MREEYTQSCAEAEQAGSLMHAEAARHLADSLGGQFDYAVARKTLQELQLSAKQLRVDKKGKQHAAAAHDSHRFSRSVVVMKKRKLEQQQWQQPGQHRQSRHQQSSSKKPKAHVAFGTRCNPPRPAATKGARVVKLVAGPPEAARLPKAHKAVQHQPGR
ncbi:hypothetical protein N2152v2_002637 [Parachlorella kessleri]